jgi:hypothetical protein
MPKEDIMNKVKAVALCVFMVGSAMACGSAVSQEQAPSQPEAVQQNVQMPAQSQAQPAAAAVEASAELTEEQKNIQQWIENLDGTSWSINITPSEGGKSFQDVLSFSGRAVSSEHFAKKGFGSSNYTLNIQGGGQAVLDTMQSNPDEGLVLWRIELSGDSIRGNLNRRPKSGKAEDYTFNGSRTMTPSAKEQSS